MTQPQIVIDPYFDGDAGAGASPQRRSDNGPPATPQNKYGYHDVSQEQVATAAGRTVSQVMRPGPHGLRGVVIPRSTVGGIPQGTRPHETAGLLVTIDPHIAGQSTQIRLGDITEESIAAAVGAAGAMTPEPYSIETQRLRGSAMMHVIAAGAQPREFTPDMSQHYPQQPQVPQAQQFQQPPTHQHPQAQVYQPQQAPVYQPQQPQDQPYAGAHHTGHPVQAASQTPQPPRRRISPLQAFNQPPQEQLREPRAIEFGDPPAPTPHRGQPPTLQVYFEMEGFGEMEAYYHDVVIAQGFLVLVFDARHRGPKFFPPTSQSEHAPKLAMNITGANEVYQLQTTGVLYEHDGYEHCVLMIDAIGALPQE